MRIPMLKILLALICIALVVWSVIKIDIFLFKVILVISLLALIFILSYL